MILNLNEKLKNASYSDGKFLSDKSSAYDTVYFISKFIKDYSVDGEFDSAKWKLALEDYIVEKWQLLDKNAGLFNYYHETVNLLEYSHVVKKEGNKIVITDPEVLNFITKDNKMENSYIYIYLLCYFTLKNSGCFQVYIDFCNSNVESTKKKYVWSIYEHLSCLNSSVKNPTEHDQWAKQNTAYILNILNFINNQPAVTRNLTLNYKVINQPKMISINVEGTKTKYPKKNDYLNNFDFEYVINNLNEYMIKRS